MLYNLFENRDFVSVFAVALLAEGVDRNSLYVIVLVTSPFVALLAEGVDRNQLGFGHRLLLVQSPSSRRAWIEIEHPAHPGGGSAVALLAEGVDRNNNKYQNQKAGQKSPSSRRAWIEILRGLSGCGCSCVALLAEGVDRNSFDQYNTLQKPVALLAEGVDRNSTAVVALHVLCGRPPRGGRG